MSCFKPFYVEASQGRHRSRDKRRLSGVEPTPQSNSERVSNGTVRLMNPHHVRILIESQEPLLEVTASFGKRTDGASQSGGPQVNTVIARAVTVQGANGSVGMLRN